MATDTIGTLEMTTMTIEMQRFRANAHYLFCHGNQHLQATSRFVGGGGTILSQEISMAPVTNPFGK